MTDARLEGLPTWAELAEDLAPDGSLRDIYVLDAAESDWTRAIELIRSGPFRANLYLDGAEEPAAFPERIEDLFSRDSKLLTFWVNETDVNCHFFTREEVEFDFWPNALDERRLHSLLKFMADLGDAISKPVLMTHENARDLPIFKYDPHERRMHWVPFQHAAES